MWWHRLVSLAHRMLRQEDCTFQTSIGYIVRIYLKNIKGGMKEGGGKGRRNWGERKGWRNFEC